jgi:hypothetical protein
MDRELSPAEIVHAKMAGIPADRPGLLGDYPKMLYRKGKPEPGSHSLASDTNGGITALPIAGHDDIETLIVASDDEELFALELGWRASIKEALVPPPEPELPITPVDEPLRGKQGPVDPPVSSTAPLKKAAA